MRAEGRHEGPRRLRHHRDQRAPSPPLRVHNDFRERLEAAGLVFSGASPDGRLVEIIELADHPWFVACQFHPEFRSRPFEPHPLFSDFIKAAGQRALESE